MLRTLSTFMVFVLCSIVDAGDEAVTVFRIEGATDHSTTAHGSCFVMRYHGKPCIITAWHVVSDVAVSEAYGGGATVKIQRRFTRVDKSDIAYVVLPVVPKGWRVLEMGSTSSRLKAMGFPSDGSGVRVVVGEDRGRQIPQSPSLVQENPTAVWHLVSGAIKVGMSGGPVMGDDGKVFGVVSLAFGPEYFANVF